MTMLYIIANDFADASVGTFPLTAPTLSSGAVRLVENQFMPRYDFVNGAWVRREFPTDGVLYANAVYELIVLMVGDVPSTAVMVRRELQEKEGK